MVKLSDSHPLIEKLLNTSSNLTFHLPSESHQDVTWSITPEIPGGARFAESATGTLYMTSVSGSNVWVWPGAVATSYQVTATSDEASCFDTRALDVVEVVITSTAAWRCAGDRPNTLFGLSSGSVSKVTWKIDADTDGLGALFAQGADDIGFANIWAATNQVWVSPGWVSSNYEITATAERVPDCVCTAYLQIVDLRINPLAQVMGAGDTNRALFTATPGYLTNILWQIESNVPGGAYVDGDPLGSNVWIAPGEVATNYILTATLLEEAICSATALFSVVEIAEVDIDPAPIAVSDPFVLTALPIPDTAFPKESPLWTQQKYIDPAWSTNELPLGRGNPLVTNLAETGTYQFRAAHGASYAMVTASVVGVTSLTVETTSLCSGVEVTLHASPDPAPLFPSNTPVWQVQESATLDAWSTNWQEVGIGLPFTVKLVEPDYYRFRAVCGSASVTSTPITVLGIASALVSSIFVEVGEPFTLTASPAPSTAPFPDDSPIWAYQKRSDGGATWFDFWYEIGTGAVMTTHMDQAGVYQFRASCGCMEKISEAVTVGGP